MKKSKKRSKKSSSNNSRSQEQTAIPFSRFHSDKVKHTTKELRRQAKKEQNEL